MTVAFTTLVVLLLVLAGGAVDSELAANEVAAIQPESSGELVVRLFDLTSVHRAFEELVRRQDAMTDGERVAAWTDFSQLAEAVVGRAPLGPFTFDEVRDAARLDTGLEVIASPGVAARNRMAYRMDAVGYSARETADVVAGRIRRRALDTARLMTAVGYGREAAVAYLDRAYVRATTPRAREPIPPLTGRDIAPEPFDVIIQRYADAYSVESAVVRAIIEVESAFDPDARSHAGAIGLMQLMPMTARELGVTPLVPEQNVEGGVRYFSQLLEKFGDLELALVAYNAGPGFAERYVRGQVVLYGETRDYVSKVLSRVCGPDGAVGGCE